MSRRITYILGAGASYNALPIVDEMNDWIKGFLLELKGKEITNNNFRIDFKYWEELVEKIKQHSTIDTYAKKLSLQNDKEEFPNLKSLISSFLYHQQTSGQGHSHTFKKKLDYNTVLSLRKKSSLDYRYDSLLASLLVNENGKIKIPDNISFISWNYDIQLELSYLNYSRASILNSILELQTIDDYTYKNIFSNGEKIDIKRSKHIKLNGTALPLLNGKVDNLTYDNFYHQDSNSYIVRDLLKNSRSEYHTTLSFAWEKKEIQNDNILKLAQNVIGMSHDIVIIGYSFPFFNRHIDRTIINRIQADNGAEKRIYLQSHPDYIERLKSDFLGIFPHLKTKTNNHIITESDLSQFVIPYDYQPS